MFSGAPRAGPWVIARQKGDSIRSWGVWRAGGGLACGGVTMITTRPRLRKKTNLNIHVYPKRFWLVSTILWGKPSGGALREEYEVIIIITLFMNRLSMVHGSCLMPHASCFVAKRGPQPWANHEPSIID